MRVMTTGLRPCATATSRSVVDCQSATNPSTKTTSANVRVVSVMVHASLRRVVNDFAVDDGDHRFQLANGVVGHALGVEVVVSQYHQIGELAGFDRAEPVFFLQEPAVLRRVQPERLHTC